jgi:hypothetical protein
MTRYPLILLPAAAAALLILSGALKQKAVHGGQATVDGSTASSDPQALAYLDRGIDTLSPERVRWLEAAVWQQVCCDEFVYQACGRLRMAPGDRSRFDVNVLVGSTQGELRQVCDGRTLQCSTRVGNDTPVVTRWGLPGTGRTEFLQEQGFAGVAPLLSSLRRGLHNVQCQKRVWKGLEVIVISGTWPQDREQFGGLPAEFKPRYQPRLCCIYLDAQTLWPHRLEWWGSERPSQANSLLVQTEFRNPVINHVLPPEQCAAEFGVGR